MWFWLFENMRMVQLRSMFLLYYSHFNAVIIPFFEIYCKKCLKICRNVWLFWLYYSSDGFMHDYLRFLLFLSSVLNKRWSNSAHIVLLGNMLSNKMVSRILSVHKSNKYPFCLSFLLKFIGDAFQCYWITYFRNHFCLNWKLTKKMLFKLHFMFLFYSFCLFCNHFYIHCIIIQKMSTMLAFLVQLFFWWLYSWSS